MLVTWLGALLIIGGVLYMARQAIWRGRLSGQPRSAQTGATLEPPERGEGFGLAANWPGLVLMALGAVLLIAEVAY
jgi:hypothetical protein